MDIGEKLRQLRLSANMTLDEVGAKVGVTKQTLYKYEAGIVTNIPISNIEKLAKTFDVPPAFIMGWDEKTTSKNIVALPSDPNRKRLAKAYNAINGEGQGKVADYAEDLDESGRYKRQDDILPLSEDIGAYIMTIGSAAAGSGYENMDDLENYRLIMTTEVPEHDFVLDVEGDSMFPTIYDGDVAFVSKTFDSVSHRIYALSLDGKTVIKRLVFGVDELTLISDNPEYDERILSGTELESVRIEGEVVGWETPVI